MELAYIFIVGSALAFLITIAIQAAQNLELSGSKPFLLQIICITIWSVGSLLEMLSPTEQGMLLWRNIQQIGIFLIPVACVYFAVDYAQYVRLRKYVPLLLIIPIIAIALIFTDSSTHIMRTGYIVSYSPLFGKALSVSQTNTGKVFVVYNYLLALISLVILFIFSRQITKALRRQVVLILIATGLVFLLGFFKTAFLEGTRINLPIVIIYLPGSMILYYNLYRNNFFRVSPIARDKVFDVIEMGIIVTDNSGMIADINPFALQLLHTCFGISEKMNGKKSSAFLGDFPDWLALMSGNTTGEVELKLINNDVHFIHIRVYPLQSIKGVLLGSVSIMRDVSVLRMQEFALKAKAETDGLTGLLNRDSFMDLFAKKLKLASSSGGTVSLLMMDLDKFKGINDTYGHNVGDQVLIAFAEILKGALRHEDAIARVGGDEFVALLPGIAGQEAVEIANRIIKSSGSNEVQLALGTRIRLKVSIGICDNQTISSADEIMKCADQAMYLAKGKAGDCCAIWE